MPIDYSEYPENWFFKIRFQMKEDRKTWEYNLISSVRWGEEEAKDDVIAWIYSNKARLKKTEVIYNRLLHYHEYLKRRAGELKKDEKLAAKCGEYGKAIYCQQREEVVKSVIEELHKILNNGTNEQ